MHEEALRKKAFNHIRYLSPPPGEEVSGLPVIRLETANNAVHQLQLYLKIRELVFEERYQEAIQVMEEHPCLPKSTGSHLTKLLNDSDKEYIDEVLFTYDSMIRPSVMAAGHETWTSKIRVLKR